ncbi:uncharacterized protein EV154DRAFT_599147 [Mucor mucedo]|uniref:Yeast cell wall synthesis Kre9/Knh1-like N-terminal domain-containing protein n=1 Tax=Mucor saturninus TaxID=64648 RepID=A0A8H7V6Y0_9FUNG|nr:uncharacterized protein EV154DRAFT_599147 [Mucor mucedo]KAG2209465.1 hypothetical protein INT47_008308 [Mucor saturninus]KAI7895548.1 hypothetical protein EV154DRAFT_599147 [Mucor mucedo]
MKFAFTILLALCLFAMTLAQSTAGIATTAPLLNATVALGSNYTIQWSVTDVNATTIESISLMQGNPLYLSVVIANILTNGSIPVSDLGYNWTVPTTLPPSTDYAFSFFGNNSGITYSPFFTLQ